MTPSRPVIHSSRTDGTVEFTVSEVVAEVDGGLKNGILKVKGRDGDRIFRQENSRSVELGAFLRRSRQ